MQALQGHCTVILISISISNFKPFRWLFCSIVHCVVVCRRAELLAQELKELQAELGDYNTVICTAVIFQHALIRVSLLF